MPHPTIGRPQKDRAPPRIPCGGSVIQSRERLRGRINCHACLRMHIQKQEKERKKEKKREREKRRRQMTSHGSPCAYAPNQSAQKACTGQQPEAIPSRTLVFAVLPPFPIPPKVRRSKRTHSITRSIISQLLKPLIS